jgi:hypothetical protein
MVATVGSTLVDMVPPFLSGRNRVFLTTAGLIDPLLDKAVCQVENQRAHGDGARGRIDMGGTGFHIVRATRLIAAPMIPPPKQCSRVLQTTEPWCFPFLNVLKVKRLK